MSFSGNLLAKSSYLPRFISLVPSKQQQSQISSQDDDIQKNRQKSLKDRRNISIGNQDSKIVNLYRKTHQSQNYHHNCQHSCQNDSFIINSQRKPKFDDLLHVPSKDYQQKSAMFLQRRMQEQIRRKHQREMYYGKRKNQIVQISDVSSQEQEEQKKQKDTKKRMIESIDFEEDELLRRYGIEKQDLKNHKNQKNKKNTKTNNNNSENNKKITLQEKKNNPRNKSNKKDERQNQNQDNLFLHLHPDFEEEKPVFSDHEESSSQMSEIDSDKSIIVIRRKKKHTHKRLKKMTHVTNKVKIENKQNSGQTHQCPICLTDLNKKLEKKKGKLPCNHLFCLKCITESSKFSNRCPYCRASYNEILSNGKRIQVQDTHYNEQFQDPNDQPCYICGRNDDFEHLLECEFCQYAYCHTYCDPRLNNRQQPPEEVWHCASCQQLLRQRDENGDFNGQGDQYVNE